jgi:hypothetical protein
VCDGTGTVSSAQILVSESLHRGFCISMVVTSPEQGLHSSPVSCSGLPISMPQTSESMVNLVVHQGSSDDAD